MRFMVIAFALALPAAGVAAGEADVEKVRISRESAGTYRFDVTVRHGDIGWKHYADAWEVLEPGGKVLGTRVLLHPHETEQPFTRSLPEVRIPPGVERVTVRAHDKIDGFGGKEITIAVPRDGGGS